MKIAIKAQSAQIKARGIARAKALHGGLKWPENYWEIPDGPAASKALADPAYGWTVWQEPPPVAVRPLHRHTCQACGFAYACPDRHCKMPEETTACQAPLCPGNPRRRRYT
jgi:hypothetical protein